MKKNTLLFSAVVGFVALLSFGIWFLNSRLDSKEATPVTSDIILFYGTECPHCQELEKFLLENNMAEKVGYDSLEVWHNSKNRDLLVAKATECNLKQEEIGVPLLYSEGKCLVGPPAIEDFFKTKAGMQ
jgi:hypothetical protein